jgi:hypothetical protein
VACRLLISSWVTPAICCNPCICRRMRYSTAVKTLCQTSACQRSSLCMLGSCMWPLTGTLTHLVRYMPGSSQANVERKWVRLLSWLVHAPCFLRQDVPYDLVLFALGSPSHLLVPRPLSCLVRSPSTNRSFPEIHLFAGRYFPSTMIVVRPFAASVSGVCCSPFRRLALSLCI